MLRSDRYTRTAVVLHWSIAALVIGQFAWGWWMQGIPKQPAGPRVDAFNLHKSVGLAILTLALVRLAWRLRHPPPPLPAMPPWQRLAARLNHGLLYALLLAMPVVGYLGSVWSGYPVRFFGAILPAWGGRNEALKDAMSSLHLGLAWVLAAAVAVHVLAVVHHTRTGGWSLLARMGWRQRSDRM